MVIHLVKPAKLMTFQLTFLGAGHETTASGLAWVYITFLLRAHASYVHLILS